VPDASAVAPVEKKQRPFSLIQPLMGKDCYKRHSFIVQLKNLVQTASR